MDPKQFLSKLILITVFNNFIWSSTASQTTTVGDDQEWSSSTNYASWAKKYNFSVGDFLVFKYVKGQHNVYEVTEETFRSCNASVGVLAKYGSGEDHVKLSEAKTYWFICNVEGHCLGGMRFSVQVKQSNDENNTNTTNLPHPLSPQIEAVPPHNACTSYISVRGISIMYLVWFEIMLFML